MQTRRALLTAAAFVPLTAALPAFGQKRVFAAKIKLLGPRVTIDVMVNGKGPYPFMIDTGGYLSLMEEGLIAELGLTRIGQIGMRGVGGSQISRLFRASDVIFGGGVRQRDVVFAAMSGGFGAGIRGVLAAGMLTQFDSELDFDRGEWRVYPDGLLERPGFVPMPSDIRREGNGSAHLFGDGSLEGKPYRFMLDTGSPHMVSLSSRTVRDSGLWNSDRPWTPMRPSGIGGKAKLARIMRLDALTLGPLRFERPLVVLNDPNGENGPAADGVIGLQILRQMNLATDVRGDKLWVQRSKIPAPPERYGMSGIWFDEDGGARVAAVGRGSPAEAAGVRVGDVAAEPLQSAMRKIIGPPGQAVSLTLKRSGQQIPVSFVLKPYL